MRAPAAPTLALLAAAPLALAAACGETPASTADAGPSADAGPTPDPTRDSGPELLCDGGCIVRRCARDVTYFDGPAEDGLEVGELQDGLFTPWVDGGDATYVFGFQGGVMLRPRVAVPDALVGDEPCVQVEVRHRPDPAYDAPGELELFPENVFTAQLEPLSGRWESRGFDDQIGWAAPDGVRALVEVEARGVDWARRAEVAVRVVDSDGWDECDVVPRQSRFGCELQLVEGAMAITAIDAPPGFACGDEVAVTVALTPTDSIPEGCVELERTLTLERGCVDAQSLEVGATLDARWELGLTDACPPDTFGLQLEGCACE